MNEKMNTQPVIGFIGLGLMGGAMVSRLQDIGYQLNVVANRSRARIDEAVSRGAQEHATAKALAEASDIVMLCMDTSDSVESRMRGEDGVLAGLSSGMVVIDFGTSLPESTKKLGEEVAAKGASMLDAPLGRTPAHALEGKLNIMASGERATFDRVEGVLGDLGENVFYLGSLGTGHTIKLINNFFGMTSAAAMCEAFAMAERSGIPPSQLYDVMSSGPLRSGMMDFVAAYSVDGDPDKLEFSLRNARKDVNYYSSMTKALGVSSLIAPGTLESLGRAVDAGMGDKHVSELVDYFRGAAATDQ